MSRESFFKIYQAHPVTSHNLIGVQGLLQGEYYFLTYSFKYELFQNIIHYIF